MTIDTIKQNNAGAGNHFFEAATLRFFRSRVSSRVCVRADGRAYFVTSERGPYGARRYTVRYTDDGGANIETEGEFQAFARASTAHARASWLASGAK